MIFLTCSHNIPEGQTNTHVEGNDLVTERKVSWAAMHGESYVSGNILVLFVFDNGPAKLSATLFP